MPAPSMWGRRFLTVPGKVDKAMMLTPGTALFKRLTDHAKSLDAATNLKLEDFRCRFLSVDDIWIPLTEFID